ncbi:hypothetical protein [Bradyrhizobium canariense]|uniref:hypothetical protein n=1 Tax=Bradyrhizobium canariense TaxID=255045 RepID=UPI00142F6DDD|nr:hypothetical protein [Bradyrhizobium canariense]
MADPPAKLKPISRPDAAFPLIAEAGDDGQARAAPTAEAVDYEALRLFRAGLGTPLAGKSY